MNYLSVRKSSLVLYLNRTGDVSRITSVGEIEYVGHIDLYANNQAYSSELRESEQTSFPQVISIVLKEPTFVPPFRSRSNFKECS